MILITSTLFPELSIEDIPYTTESRLFLSNLYGHMTHDLNNYFSIFNKFPNLIISNLNGVSGKKYDVAGRVDITSHSYPELIVKLMDFPKNEYFIVESMFINNRGVCRIFAFTLDSFVCKDVVKSFIRKSFIDKVLQTLD